MAVEGMTALKDSRVANADLSGAQYKFVKLLSTGKVDLITAVTDVPYGVLQNKPTSGKMAEILIIGITKMVAGAATTVGLPVGADSTGRAVTTYVAGTDTTKYNVGACRIAASAAAEITTVVVNCASPARFA